MRRQVWCVVLAALMCVGLVSSAGAELSVPNIVILLADDLGWGDVGYHGSRIATPNIDRLAAKGVRLEQFYAQPVCSPTRGALMTGRYPMRLGLQCGVVRPWASHGLPLDEQTLPDMLREIGYRTAIVGKWHLGHVSREYLPTSRGFDQQYGHYNGALDYFTHDRDGGHDWHKNDQRNDDEGYTTDLIGREAVRIIKEHPANRPLFLYVPFNAPHTPLQAPEEELARYADWKNRDRATYAAMVTRMDSAVGGILDAIDAMGPMGENTIVFFCSDNGGVASLGSNGDLRDGKGTLYEGGVRVPAIMAWPQRLAAGGEVHEPMHVVDVMPTLLALTEAAPNPEKMLDGLNCWSTIAKGEPSPHAFVLHNTTPFSGALRVGDWKLVYNGGVGANAIKGPAEDRWELFNIAEDLSEAHDLAAKHPEIVAKLRAQLESLAAEAAPPHLLTNQPPAGFTIPTVWGEHAAKPR
jgi:arylsulfatase A-like enzyme